MKKRTLLLAAAIGLPSALLARGDDKVPRDTVRTADIEEVVVIASPKETGKLRESPAAVSIISQADMRARQVRSLKGASALAPNFFMPDYGSRLTSAIYIRGIGSRINTPAAGLYVDNIPYVDKSAFDFSFYDIERIDILRGPQGTLYGRNTMGGLVKVHTRSPFSYQGTDLKLGFATRNNRRSASLTHYHRRNERLAFSAGGYYEGSDGFFRNALDGKKVDGGEAGGGRLRAIALPSENVKVDFSLGYEYSDEGGYPYALGDAIAYNRECSYRRGLLNAGVNVEWQAHAFTLNAVTGFQRLTDRMFLDQDFTPADIYTLEQRQRLHTLSEEVTLKGRPGRRWQWVTGASGFRQWLHTDGPVTFMEEGVRRLIEDNVNATFDALREAHPSMPAMGLTVTSATVPVAGRFDTPALSGAVFHQSTLRDFPLRGLSLTAGLRLEYEKLSLDYRSGAAVAFDFALTSPAMPRPVTLAGLEARPELEGRLRRDYVQLLPKAAVQYALPGAAGSLYASVARGYRSGGYNVQMFSDLVQAEMRGGMTDAIDEASGGMMSRFTDPEALKARADIAAVSYRPEHSWNYEAGAHLTLLGGRLRADAAVFLMDTRDQQVARFAGSGLGRMMTNAGSSRSRGAELSLSASAGRGLGLTASYGYTRSTFRDYDDGSGEDYSGRYVPFVPRHTLSAGADYTFALGPAGTTRLLTLGLDCAGAGKIYWTERNDAAQDFYATLNARVSFRTKSWQADLWGRNLTGRDYDTFYFESLGNGFHQRGKPAQFGVDLHWHF